MKKSFTVTGLCVPARHYMVDLSSRVKQIADEYVAPGKYFTINRARQYGKTTTLFMLEENLKQDYLVLSLSFEAADDFFTTKKIFADGLIMEIASELRRQKVQETLLSEWKSPVSEIYPMVDLDDKITWLCQNIDRKIVLMIDEVDKSSDNQLFLSFLGLLRKKYLNQMAGKDTTFWSVILAGVYDIKNLKQKIHPEEESKYNSPWNIAADFTIDMSFSPKDISTMLTQYEEDWDTGMEIDSVSQTLYDYTSGYPYLVSRLCQFLAEKVKEDSTKQERKNAWYDDAIQDAVRRILKEPNTLFDDMSKKLEDYPKLKEMIYSILFQGQKYTYEAENDRIRIGVMFGFLKDVNGTVAVSNRIFEMKLYNLFLSEDETGNRMFSSADMEKSRFVKGGCLQMDLVLQKFCEYFEDIYADADDKFIEDNGRRIFLIFLKPIINGSGNYYVEARTRNMKRTDVIIDYRSAQFVLEMKIYHGQEYNRRGENQLLEYMDYYHLQKGYMLSFNFNKKKQTGMRQILLGDRVLVEAVV
ncbi:MAG: AAA-like domain-containing protein [Lachnospiraceae bacterium]|nr:AAA-like domain-containing protein [Lachnospiraceae bacterium]